MKIRDKLSLQFTLISALLLFTIMAGIFILTVTYRNNDFYEHLKERAITNAELFLAQDNLSADKFLEVQKKFTQSLPHEIVRIYDDSDQPVFIKDNSYQFPKIIIEEVKKTKSVFYTSKDERQTLGIYYPDNSGNFIVIASAINTYGIRQTQQLFWILLAAFFISLFIMFFTGRLFSKIALSPMIKVINDVKIIRSTSLDKRLKIKKGKDEINELTNTFNNLLEHLEQSFEAQKSFVANASHELRTPITAIIGNIEVALGNERRNEEYKTMLYEVLDEAEKLNDLINNLFELAQTNIDITEFHQIRLDELIWQVKDEWANKIENSCVELSYDHVDDKKKYTILGNSYLLFMAIGNIMKNAIKFSNNKPVMCSLYLHNNEPVISILDSGIGISKDDIQNIFQPFFRGKNTFGYVGYGIGLSLSEKILKLHNVRITVNSELNQGSEFILTFSN
ncbi:MAG: HAMP domain-containing histidine kinase [Bacteroidetes bacterium]|nr:HAMP domain-containing histidine kinase [Bacteroidota bacterium]